MLRGMRVRELMKSALTALCSLLITACASTTMERAPVLQIEGVRMENQTQMWVSAVSLLVPVSGNFVSCGNISPGTMCSTTFPETGYTGNPVEITWSQGGQIHSTGQFVLQIPEQLDKTRPALVRVVISGPTSAGAILVQRQE